MDKFTIRVSMLGGRGTGKSVFFAGVVQAFINGTVTLRGASDSCEISLKPEEIRSSSSGIFMMDENAEDGITIMNSMQAAAKLRDWRINRSFADILGTNASTEFTFSLCINGVSCCNLVFTDYAGELLDSPNNEDNRDDLQRLCSGIASSDAIIIIADTEKASENWTNTYYTKRALCADTLCTYFPTISDAVMKQKRKLTTVIAMTKSDSLRINDNYKRDGYADMSLGLMKDIYDTVNVHMNRGIKSPLKWTYAAIPVSAVGQGNVDAYNNILENAEISQENIDKVLLFCVYTSITRIVEEFNDSINSLRTETRAIAIRKDAKEEKRIKKEKLSESEEQLRQVNKFRAVFAASSVLKSFNNMQGGMAAALPSMVGK